MSSNLPWDNDYVPLHVVPTKKSAELIYYVVRANIGDIPDDENGNRIDFTILEGTKADLFMMGYDESNIFTSVDLALLSGALRFGYFEDLLKNNSAYAYYKKHLTK